MLHGQWHHRWGRNAFAVNSSKYRVSSNRPITTKRAFPGQPRDRSFKEKSDQSTDSSRCLRTSPMLPRDSVLTSNIPQSTKPIPSAIKFQELCIYQHPVQMFQVGGAVLVFGPRFECCSSLSARFLRPEYSQRVELRSIDHLLASLHVKEISDSRAIVITIERWAVVHILWL